MKKQYLVFLITTFCINISFSQNNQITYSSFITNGSTHQNYFNTTSLDTTTNSTKKWYKTDTGKSLIASGGLIAIGMYTYKDEGFLNRVTIKEGINRYLPDFENHLDDYTQYIPFVGVYALDLAGVKSKHKTLRKTTTMTTALLLNLLVIQSLKYAVAEPRPDGSANNSFPSGHTATAFMGAHIFHKEYGERSPYYSVGAYLLASVTGIFRQLNNKHWSSDVLVGAGLGISLTELAYYFNDLYYKTDGINEIILKPIKEINHNKPSFLGIKAGYAGLTESFNAPELGISSKSGFSIEIEGAYFFNPYIGIGGNIGIQSFPIKIDDAVQQEFKNDGYDIAFEPMGNSKYTIGPFLQLPFGKNFIGTKFLIGTASIADTKVRLTKIEGDDITESDDIIFAELIPDNSITWSTGIYFKRLLSDKLTLGFYVDYNGADLNLNYTYLDDIINDEPIYATGKSKGTFDSISIGGTVGVMIW